jgi:Bestrophin, RFP-TM, chloride channel
MHSKWLDVGMELAAFHLQSKLYDARRPPAFGAYPELNSLERARERLNELTLKQLEEQLDEMEHDEMEMEKPMSSFRSRTKKFLRHRRNNCKLPLQSEVKQKTALKATKTSSAKPKTQKHVPRTTVGKSINAVRPKNSQPAASIQASPFSITNWFHSNTVPSSPVNTPESIETNVVQSRMPNRYEAWDPDKPPLFLQEAAHLLSLLSAVAFSTLRNDLEQADSPLIPFTEGAPWPHVDPDAYTADVRKDWDTTGHRSITVLRYIFGFSRTPASRTLYNAARPFRVIGGVSDAEIEMLQAARGPLAKVALCTMWLQEFISREYLAGSTGNVAAPILSRLYQFVSDGMLGYNHARKVAYIPFPFPHAQITSLFVLIVVGFMPVLMLAYLTNVTFGFFLNFLTVMCFSGLHEVARELESPFQNVPNDHPLNNMQAQYNESLMQMFSGYHPDAYWEVAVKDDNEHETTQIVVSTRSDENLPEVLESQKVDKSLGARYHDDLTLFEPNNDERQANVDDDAIVTTV